MWVSRACLPADERNAQRAQATQIAALLRGGSLIHSSDGDGGHGAEAPLAQTIR